MTHKDFIPKSTFKNTVTGTLSCQSPSNIALVKYWGKHGEQLPQNASVSFTLTNCHTKTTLEFSPKTSKGFDFTVYLDGKKEQSFEPKIKTFFNRIVSYVPFIEAYRFIIRTTNSFPHSSGIASSASGMSALAMCIVSMEDLLLSEDISDTYKKQKASFLARLGSGSASRSIEGPLVVWGAHSNIDGSSDLFGTIYPKHIHKNFTNYKDTILLVDKGEKQVSSTVGHDLMHNHPYSAERFKEANNNLTKLISIFENGALSEFIKIVESEALQLHAMMMTSQPYFILMKPNTLEIINRIWSFRKKTKSMVCFTLDAGANVHVLYPENETEIVSEFIKKELTPFCKNGDYIEDVVGLGSKLI
ncbi:diphosphomevalonate/mevalonate 3,5-bisphosphate decarboxylase family protein [Jejudonia soesokkakensis]|uniref:Diphosphomevalonate/mevalonate 3,5-bisphosphate decarboxylase family protein n=1 Tax=Jejudonia soesokkakensis TaxID=1323432 RepID=A0ABW2MWX0_9FLAO